MNTLSVYYAHPMHYTHYISLSLLCFQFYLLLLPEFPTVFTHYSYIIPMPSPIIPIIFLTL